MRVSVGGRVVVDGAPTNADAVVSLTAPGLKLSPPADPLVVDQKGMRFVPHVVAVQAGTTVRFLNSDREPHNVYSPEGRYNLGTWSAGDARERLFAAAGTYSQLCGLHPDMRAYVVVLETPYFAVTDAAGAFAIRGVPAGFYTLAVWHEAKEGLERSVTLEAARPLTLELRLER
jgi:plastocyanin